jgi:hypothetical protein
MELCSVGTRGWSESRVEGGCSCNSGERSRIGERVITVRWGSAVSVEDEE